MVGRSAVLMFTAAPRPYSAWPIRCSRAVPCASRFSAAGSATRPKWTVIGHAAATITEDVRIAQRCILGAPSRPSMGIGRSKSQGAADTDDVNGVIERADEVISKAGSIIHSGVLDERVSVGKVDF